jgi:uncharacterized protein (DUF3084 family)
LNQHLAQVNQRYDRKLVDEKVMLQKHAEAIQNKQNTIEFFKQDIINRQKDIATFKEKLLHLQEQRERLLQPL